jgi:hypothetical protein
MPQVRSHDFATEVVEALSKFETGEAGSMSDQIVILPKMIKGGVGWYPSSLIYTVKLLRKGGAESARFLHLGDDRRFLDEHSSEIVWVIGLGITSSLSAEGIITFWNYLEATVRKKWGTSTDDARVRIEIARLKRGDLKVEGLVIEGNVNEDLRTVLKEVLGAQADE